MTYPTYIYIYMKKERPGDGSVYSKNAFLMFADIPQVIVVCNPAGGACVRPFLLAQEKFVLFSNVHNCHGRSAEEGAQATGDHNRKELIVSGTLLRQGRWAV